MSDELKNQTDFTTEQQFVTAPSPVQPQAPQENREVKKPSPLLFVLILFIVLSVVGFIGYFATQHSGSGQEKKPTPLPTVLPTPSTNELEQEINPMLDRAEQGDPDKQSIPFPPIDFDLRLKDAREVRN